MSGVLLVLAIWCGIATLIAVPFLIRAHRRRPVKRRARDLARAASPTTTAKARQLIRETEDFLRDRSTTP